MYAYYPVTDEMIKKASKHIKAMNRQRPSTVYHLTEDKWNALRGYATGKTIDEDWDSECDCGAVKHGHTCSTWCKAWNGGLK